MSKTKISIKTKAEDDRLVSDLILVQKGTFNRFAIGGVPKGHEGRKEHGGDMVPGPWHYMYGLCAVIAKNPAHSTSAEMEKARNENRVIEVSDGTELKIDGLPYVIRKSWNGVLVLEESKKTAKKLARRAK